MLAHALALGDARQESADGYAWLAERCVDPGFICWSPFAFVSGPPLAQALAAAAFACGRTADGVRHAADALDLCRRVGARAGGLGRAHARGGTAPDGGPGGSPRTAPAGPGSGGGARDAVRKIGRAHV